MKKGCSQHRQHHHLASLSYPQSIGTFCLTHFLSLFFTVARVPVLILTWTALCQWTALCLKLALTRYDSPLKVSPNLIWPLALAERFVLYGCCVTACEGAPRKKSAFLIFGCLHSKDAFWSVDFQETLIFQEFTCSFAYLISSKWKTSHLTELDYLLKDSLYFMIFVLGM